MKKYILILILPVFIVFIDGCGKDNDNLSKGTTDFDPWEIPLRRRENEFLAGNKVHNPSFEQGRFFRDHINTFEIDGWKEITHSGEEVEWVDTEKEKYSQRDVYSGYRAIKINRAEVDETDDKGVGVISDYIKVIPGNYSLEYHIKLKNIHSHKKRFGSRLMDAVNVRIHYYNKNKIEIGSNMVNPADGSKFDNGFKAFQFSGLWGIDSLGWTKTQGISHRLPFLDGDIPKETRYVRLFFGLKGQGTMWIDNVSLKYTKYNFTLAERLNQFVQKDYHPAELIIPKPKHIEPKTAISYFDKEKPESKPAIMLPEKPDALSLEAAKLLRQKLMESISSVTDKNVDIPILEQNTPINLENFSLVFAIGISPGDNQVVPGKEKTTMKNNPQGYFITRLNDTSNIVFLKGNQPKGNFYAVNTINQLLSDSVCQYHHTEIADYPDYSKRAVVTKTDHSTISEFDHVYDKLKLSHLFLDVEINEENKQLFQKWNEKIALKTPAIKKGIALRPSDIDLKNEMHGSINKAFDYSEIKQFINSTYERGVKEYLILLNDIEEDTYNTNNKFDGQRVNQNNMLYRSLCDIHTELIEQIYNWIPEQTKLYLKPVWNSTDMINQSHGRGEIYLNELFRKIPDKVQFLWSGATKNPGIVDNIEMYHIEKISGKTPVFFCNNINPLFNDELSFTLPINPPKLRMHSLFKNFVIQLPDNFFKNSGEGSFFAHIDLRELTPIKKIQLSTLADYLWNSENYNPDESLYISLLKTFGKENTINLIEFNQLYMGLYDLYLRNKNQGMKRKNMKTAEEYIQKMNVLTEKFEQKMENDKMKNTLIHMKNEMESLYNQMIK
ncbi:MAG: beta-N-acetylglucosaminidase domain-containing protein [Bacteroidales bacterium]